MIAQIKEINFPSYATLSEATATFAEMGERTISAQVKIDPTAISLDFSGWELEFKGERFILPILEPQAEKSVDSISPKVNLVFSSWAILQMQRYLFAETATIEAGTIIADRYKTGFSLDIRGFVDAFNKVLDYYFDGKIQMDLYQKETWGYSNDPVAIVIDNSYIWEVLQKVYELYKYRWRIEYRSNEDKYYILVNYPSETISDHDFEYGYAGGLLKFERQVQDYDIKNILLGRGGEKNLPYRYFKAEDPYNTIWPADPDAIPELKNIYFDRLRDAHFRWYVRGWMKNSHRDPSWEEQGYVYPTYDEQTIPEEYIESYQKGKNDEKFNPVEYVKDDVSIQKYGERWGALADDDEIYPTIQGVTRPGLGRVDEVVAVSEIVNDDIENATAREAVGFDIPGANKTIMIVPSYSETYSIPVRGESFEVPSGEIGFIRKSGNWFINASYARVMNDLGFAVTRKARAEDQALISIVDEDSAIKVFDESTNQEVSYLEGLQPGKYYYTLQLAVKFNYIGSYYIWIEATVGINGLHLTRASESDGEGWQPTFDIWIKNIWETAKTSGETDEAYAERVWYPILGDRVGNDATVVFSTGFMSISEDYNFLLATYPVLDRTKTFVSSDGSTYTSEWKLTLRKSDAEYDATGLYLPNAKTGGQPAPGDHFFFTGIDCPAKYVQWAEEKLTDEKNKNLQDVSEINPTWVITLDKVRIHTKEDSDYSSSLAERLSAGAIVRTKDKRFTNGNVLSLYIQNITYIWHEASLAPDVEVVLSDKLLSSESPLAVIQGDISVVRSTYAKASDVESIVRQIAGKLFLGKTGEKEVSYSPTAFNSLVNSKNFRMGGIGGRGWGMYVDGNGNHVFETDRIIVRQDLSVNNLISNQITYIGGKNIQSAASIECTSVVETDNGYICYFDQKQGSRENFFVINDIALGQVFNADNTEAKFYKRLVTAIDENSITLSKTEVNGEGVPAEGDIIVQYGNISDERRQFVVITDVIGGGYQQMLSGLDSVNATGEEYYFAGTRNQSTPNNVSPRWFVGSAEGEYAEWADGILNIKGTIQVRKSDGTYTAISGYLDTLDYLHNALPDAEEVTTITGGVVLSTIIGVQSGGKLVAGLNSSSLGQDETYGKLMIFAGAADASQVVDAKFKVYEDGRFEATDAAVSGKITASSGSIGGFEIAPGRLGVQLNTIDGMTLSEELLAFSANNFNIQARIGASVLPDTTGMSALALLSADDTALGRLTGIGLYINIKGFSYENDAIRIENGTCAGLRPDIKIASGGQMSLTDYNFTVIVNSATTLALPANPKRGQTYLIFIPTVVRVIIDGQGKQIHRIGYSAASTVTHSSFNGIDVLVYNGSYWNLISIDNV